MILAALVLAAAFSSPVEDYFPMTPGLKLTYEDADGRTVVDEIGQPIDIGKGVMATPKTTSLSGRSSGSELYRVDGNTLVLVGYIDKTVTPPEPSLKVLKDPQPILRVGAGKEEWKFVGEVPTGLGPVLLRVTGNSRPGGKRKVLGNEVDTLKVHVQSLLGNEKQGVEIRQDVVYGKGVGMVEMDEATKAQGQTVKKMLKLVKLEPPKG